MKVICQGNAQKREKRETLKVEGEEEAEGEVEGAVEVEVDVVEEVVSVKEEKERFLSPNVNCQCK